MGIYWMKVVPKDIWGEGGWSAKIIIDPPQNVLAVTSMTGGHGRHHFSGISALTHRPTEDGEDVPENYGGWWNWLAAVYREPYDYYYAGYRY